MILLAAIAAGLLAGLIRASLLHRRYAPPPLRHAWVVAVAFLPQLVILFLPGAGRRFPEPLVGAVLVASQATLLAFAIFNRNQAGLALLGAGLLLNLLVISANGGFMPITPANAASLTGSDEADRQSGERFSVKDKVLEVERTRLPWLSDRFLSPVWIAYRFAFSIGDLLIALGAFLFLGFPPLAPKELAPTA